MKEVKVYANIRQEVKIDPIDVLQELIVNEIGQHNWVFEENGKFYLGNVESAGCHSFESKKEVTQELYEYITAIQLIIKRLGMKEKSSITKEAVCYKCGKSLSEHLNTFEGTHYPI